MPTSDEYRKTAEECYRLANEAKTETERLALLDLAHTWLEAASRQEEMTPAQIAEALKLPSESKREPATSQPQARSGWRQRILRLFR
ncbi:MAG TPA: hypothetical protein VGJ20_02110 [Xanthobacteraceae bacterium]|jgi:hypothetical protein